MTQTISCLYADRGNAAAAAAKLKRDRQFAQSVLVEDSPGGTRVTVQAPFESGARAMGIMDAHEPIESDVKFRSDFGVLTDPAPLSHFFGLPILTKGRARAGGLLSSDWSLSRLVGLPLLSDDATPLSDKLHMPTLAKKGAPSWPFFLLSKNPAPLSRALGLPTLIEDPVDASPR